MKMRTKQSYIVFLFVVICITVMCGCSQNKALSFEATYAIDGAAPSGRRGYCGFVCAGSERKRTAMAERAGRRTVLR